MLHNWPSYVTLNKWLIPVCSNNTEVVIKMRSYESTKNSAWQVVNTEK